MKVSLVDTDDLVTKRGTESASASGSGAGRVLPQLAAFDRARNSIDQTCQQIATAADCATTLHAKIQVGTERFIGNWNTAHPDQMIRRCRGAASNCSESTAAAIRLLEAQYPWLRGAEKRFWNRSHGEG